MSLVGQSQVNTLHISTQVPQLEIQTPPDTPRLEINTGREGQKPGGLGVSRLDLDARAQQMQIVRSLKEKPVEARDINVKNILSKQGLSQVIGKASRHANVKDAMMRATYKMVNRESAGAEFGSLHKSALRLADKYQKQLKEGAPEQERNATLRQLKTTLENMKAKKDGDDILLGRYDEEKSANSPVATMIRYVEVELGMAPSVRAEKGKAMWQEEYPQLKQNSTSIHSKIELLESAHEHLQAAVNGGHDDDETRGILDDVHKELSSLKSHAPLKDELEGFVKDKDKNLKKVITREVNPVDEMRAKNLHKKHMKEVTDDRSQAIGHLARNRDIRSFDKSQLKHVETRERSGLENAREMMEADSLIDQLAINQGGPEIPQGESLVHDPDIGHLTSHTTESEVFKGMGHALQKAVGKKDDEAIGSLGEELGHLIAEDLRNHPKDVQLGFATSRGEAFKKDLLARLNSQLEGGKPLVDGEEPSPRVKAFIDKAYATAVSNLTDRYVDQNTVVLDGVTYTKVGTKGSGANGTVDLYEGMKGGVKHEIIVKTPIVMDDEPETMTAIFNSTASEARLHRDATGDGHPNVTGFLGAMQTPDGRVLVVMDYAELGPVHDITETLVKAVDEGRISQHAANLVRITLLRDMAQGLQHLQEDRGMTHLDLKPANYFLNGKGEAMLGDFGTAGIGETRTLKQSVVDSADYTAPEYIQGKRDKGERIGQIAKAQQNLEDNAVEELQGMRKKDQAEFREQVKEQLKEMDKLIDQESFQVSMKADVWSLGTAAYQLFFNEKVSPASARFVFQQEKDLMAFGSNKENRHQGLGLDGEGNKTGMGVTSLDRLLNAMLHPDPEERPSMTAILNHSLFTEDGVGSQEVRDLIKLIADPNATPESLKAASDKIGV